MTSLSELLTARAGVALEAGVVPRVFVIGVVLPLEPNEVSWRFMEAICFETEEVLVPAPAFGPSTSSSLS